MRHVFRASVTRQTFVMAPLAALTKSKSQAIVIGTCWGFLLYAYTDKATIVRGGLAVWLCGVMPTTCFWCCFLWLMGRPKLLILVRSNARRFKFRRVLTEKLYFSGWLVWVCREEVRRGDNDIVPKVLEMRCYQNSSSNTAHHFRYRFS